jgi:hypothetical protein
MVNQTQDGFSIMRLQGTFLFFSALWALGMTSFVCRIGWEWFLSWDHQYWELFGQKKWKKYVQKGAHFSMFFGQKYKYKNSGGTKMGEYDKFYGFVIYTLLIWA